jgi:L,D-transpeptidase ErfK/SrfK
MLTHQGPPIPARRLARDSRHQVLAGPYPSRAAAVAATRRIARDLGEDGTPVRLPQTVASHTRTEPAAVR